MKIRKVSVVTVCLNAGDVIRLTLESVASQSHPNVEHVVIDGGSNDGTQDIVSEYRVAYFCSEKDGGVYDAMDKGAKAINGDIVIFLNAGDCFFNSLVCSEVSRFFELSGADIVFGNLMPTYLSADATHDHGAFHAGKLLDLGYVQNRRYLYNESIHHQATFYKKWVLKDCTYLCKKFPEATGEYNLLMDAVFKKNAKVKHIPIPISRFLLGGISTKNFDKEWARYINARKILRNLYCPNQKSIAISSAREFLMRADKRVYRNFQPRITLKNFIKSSLFFKVYDRLITSLTSRIINTLNLAINGMLDRKMQSVRDDLLTNLDTKLEKYFIEQNLAYSEIIRQTETSNKGIANVLNIVNDSSNFTDHGYKVYSQWNEDGLIQHIISCCMGGIKNSFVELGVGDYSESNTRFLLENDNWSGFVVDSSPDNIKKIQNNELSWRYGLRSVCSFLTCENINELLSAHGLYGEIGLLSIDIDGVDYWLWKSIDLISPQIVICEYNGIFGSRAKVTVPYESNFDRTKKHYSWLYAGASIAALTSLAAEKGYTLLGANSGGNNAFFIRNDVLKNSKLKVASQTYIKPVFRGSRAPDGSLSYLSLLEGSRLIQSMMVFDVELNKFVKIQDISILHD